MEDRDNKGPMAHLKNTAKKSLLSNISVLSNEERREDRGLKWY